MNTETRIVDPSEFVREMERHWTENLHNVPSEPLRLVWNQLAGAFNFHIESDSIPTMRKTWTILQPPTGSGKTQGTMVYCSMLSRFTDEQHPGILIVTRLIDECNQLAQEINSFGERETAIAFHSDTKDIGITELWLYPVLVITHKAYEMALDTLNKGESSRLDRWSFFHDYLKKDRKRKLVVIDECLDIVEENKVTLDALNAAKGKITSELRRQFPKETEAVDEVIELLEVMAGAPSPQREKLLKEHPKIAAGKPLDFTEFRRAFLGKCEDRELLDKDYLRELDQRLKALHHLFRAYAYYARIEGKDTLSTARLLVPDDIKGAAVLDATASSNLIYELFDQAFVITPPQGSRRYENVTLHASIDHKTGKRYMVEHAKALSGEFLSALEDELSPDRKCLVVTHKDVESPLKAFKPQFDMETTHWGKHTGSNEWKDCDACAVFGLPWWNPTRSANTYFACQGPDDSILNGDKTFKNHTNIRQAIETGQIVVDIVQAINRVRSRRVIDTQGNCEPVDVYLLLPKGDRSREILKGIKKEMPGVKIVDWEYKGQRHKIKKSRYAEALVTYWENMEPGACLAVGHVRNVIGMGLTQLRKLIKEAQIPFSALRGEMGRIGVEYIVRREGKKYKAYFLKA